MVANGLNRLFVGDFVFFTLNLTKKGVLIVNYGRVFGFRLHAETMQFLLKNCEETPGALAKTLLLAELQRRGLKPGSEVRRHRLDALGWKGDLVKSSSGKERVD